MERNPKIRALYRLGNRSDVTFCNCRTLWTQLRVRRWIPDDGRIAAAEERFTGADGHLTIDSAWRDPGIDEGERESTGEFARLWFR